MTTELTMLAWTIVLGIVHLFVVSQFFTAKNGLGYGAGPRDEPARPLDGLGGRLERAFRNLMETFPFAAAAILVAATAGRHNGWTSGGAQLYFWCRLVYVPLYAAGVPYVRSAVWLGSIAGIFLVLVGLVAG